jgi:stage IV sporulation protein FB
VTYQLRQMFEFKIFNIPVKVEPWFWIVLALIGGATGADSKAALLQILMFIVAGFISILVHELGHALTARHFGHRVNILLHGFGGLAFYQGGGQTRQRTFLITAAGPAIQIALGLVVLAFYNQFDGISTPSRQFLWILYWISFVWAILNLLPILPLDGGRLLESILGPGRIRLTLTISLTVAALVCLFCLSSGRIFGAMLTGMFAYESYKGLKQLSYR